MTPLDRSLGIVAALAATMGIAWASNVRVTPYASHDGVLRLAWTARPERVEDCRLQSEEALAKLPPHMRQALICEGTTASYRLEVRREGSDIVDQIVRGGGLRHDRSLYVFRDIPLPPGETDISVRFVRIDPTTTSMSLSGSTTTTESLSYSVPRAGSMPRNQTRTVGRATSETRSGSS